MKKLTSGLLAIILCMGLSVVSFAETKNSTTNKNKVYISKISFEEKGTFTVDGKDITATVYHVPDNATITIKESESGLIAPGGLYIYDFVSGTSFKLEEDRGGVMGPVTITGNILVKYGNVYCTANKGKLWEESTDTNINQDNSNDITSSKHVITEWVVDKKTGYLVKRERTVTQKEYEEWLSST